MIGWSRSALAATAAAGFVGCSLAAPLPALAQDAGDVTVTWARTGFPDSLDPHQFSHIEGAIAIMNMLDTLVWRDAATNTYHGGLASGWTYAEDLTSLTLELREDVVFHDGTPFNAQAVAFTFDRIVDPDTQAAAVASFMGSYSGHEVLDDYTIRIDFTEPNPLFLEWLTHPSLAPISPTAVQEFGDAFRDNLVGTGPFRLVEWDRANNAVIMERNPDYGWAPAFLGHEGPPNIDRLVMRGVLDVATRLAALEAGEVDFAQVSALDTLRLSEDPAYTLWSSPTAGITHSLAFNTERAPLNELAVRKALISSVDLDALNAVVFRGLHEIPTGPFRRGVACWSASPAELWPYDTDAANAMLDEAGWLMGDDGIRQKDGERLGFTMLWPDADDPAPVVFIQSEWRKIGADLQIRTMDFNAIISESQRGNHDMTWGSVAASDPDVARTVFGTGQARNFTRVSDAQLDELLAAGTATADIAERCEIYEQVQRRVMDLALIMPYYDATAYTIGAADITGLRYRGDGVMPINTALQRGAE